MIFKKNTVWNSIFFLICNGLTFSEVVAQETQSKSVLSFEPPQLIDAIQPEYPRISLQRGDEGWVMLNYMVDTEGAAYEPMVIGSSGDVGFEKAALEALSKSKFEPAKINGVAVDGSKFYKYSFHIAGGVGASPSFGRKYRAFNRALAENDLEKAAKLLAQMEKVSLDNVYESAFTNLSKFFMAKQQGDTFVQMNSLEKALAYSSDSENKLNFLDEETASAAREQLFKLEIQNQYFAEAISTFRWIERSDSEQQVELLRGYYDKIVGLADDDTVYAIAGEIEGLVPWYLKLHKSSFYISDVTGQLDEIKLRCNGKYAIFAYNSEDQYSVPESWGRCLMQIVGDPQTTFSVVQFSAEI